MQLRSNYRPIRPNIGKAQTNRFRCFTPEPMNEQIWKGSGKIHLRAKDFVLFQYLPTHPGQLATKDDLMGFFWRTAMWEMKH